jgi:hypothetical protein
MNFEMDGFRNKYKFFDYLTTCFIVYLSASSVIKL